DHLQYLKDFGVTTLWLTPVNDNFKQDDYHGYGSVDFYKVEEHFGDLAKYKELVERAHSMGIKIIQDEVINHTGPNHPWADAAPTATFLNGSPQHHLDNVFDIAAITAPASNQTNIE